MGFFNLQKAFECVKFALKNYKVGVFSALAVEISIFVWALCLFKVACVKKQWACICVFVWGSSSLNGYGGVRSVPQGGYYWIDISGSNRH